MPLPSASHDENTPLGASFAKSIVIKNILNEIPKERESMKNLSILQTEVIEKQELVVNKLTTLSYVEVIQLMARLSLLISDLDKIQIEHEIQCNKFIVRKMEQETKGVYSKAEAMMKASDLYWDYKNTLSAKQSAVSALHTAKIHIQYLLRSKMVDENALQLNSSSASGSGF